MLSDAVVSGLAAVSVSVLLAMVIWMSAGVIVRIAYPGLRNVVLKLAPRTRANVLLLMQCTPAAFAALSVALLYSPVGARWLVTPHCHEQIGCEVHAPTSAVAADGNWLIAAALFVCLFAIWRVFCVTRDYCHRRAQLAQLTVPDAEADYAIIDTLEPTAFTFGLLQPHIYLSRSLAEQLEPAQLNALIEHEQAHCQRKDGLRRMFVVLTAPPGQSTAQLASDWYDAVEQAADRAASCSGNLPMAEALICSHRLSASRVGNGPALEARIGQILSPRTEGLIDRWLPGLTLAAIVLLVVSSIDGGHLLIEWLLSLL